MKLQSESIVECVCCDMFFLFILFFWVRTHSDGSNVCEINFNENKSFRYSLFVNTRNKQKKINHLKFSFRFLLLLPFEMVLVCKISK